MNVDTYPTTIFHRLFGEDFIAELHETGCDGAIYVMDEYITCIVSKYWSTADDIDDVNTFLLLVDQYINKHIDLIMPNHIVYFPLGYCARKSFPDIVRKNKFSWNVYTTGSDLVIYKLFE